MTGARNRHWRGEAFPVREHRYYFLECGIEMAEWLIERNWVIPTATEVAARFPCSRATAYRYVQAIRDVVARRELKQRQAA